MTWRSLRGNTRSTHGAYQPSTDWEFRPSCVWYQCALTRLPTGLPSPVRTAHSHLPALSVYSHTLTVGPIPSVSVLCKACKFASAPCALIVYLQVAHGESPRCSAAMPIDNPPANRGDLSRRFCFFFLFHASRWTETEFELTPVILSPENDWFKLVMLTHRLIIGRSVTLSIQTH